MAFHSIETSYNGYFKNTYETSLKFYYIPGLGQDQFACTRVLLWLKECSVVQLKVSSVFLKNDTILNIFFYQVELLMILIFQVFPVDFVHIVCSSFFLMYCLQLLVYTCICNDYNESICFYSKWVYFTFNTLHQTLMWTYQIYSVNSFISSVVTIV